MASNAAFAEVAALAGDPTRAAILHSLMDGRALTASELARLSGVAPQTASGHLARLISAGLLAVHRQGRHRYHRLASPAVAQMMESIMQVASIAETERPTVRTGPRDPALRAARTCYDHLAGRLGVALADALVAGGHMEMEKDAGVMTSSGMALLRRVGIDVDGIVAKVGKRGGGGLLCRPCIDWSERRPHVAGAVGAALCAHCFAKDWIRRSDGTRAVKITPKGLSGLREAFGIDLA